MHGWMGCRREWAKIWMLEASLPSDELEISF